jgi:hypothetical protein
MASALLALADAAADQENVDPSIDIIANVRSSARGVRAVHIDGSAKETRKRSRGPRSSDAEKIESLLCFIDGAETAFALANGPAWVRAGLGGCVEGAEGGEPRVRGDLLLVLDGLQGEESSSRPRRTWRRISPSPSQRTSVRRRDLLLVLEGDLLYVDEGPGEAHLRLLLKGLQRKDGDPSRP